MRLEFTGTTRSIADPWYNHQFDMTYRDIVEGCQAFLNYLYEKRDIVQ